MCMFTALYPYITQSAKDMLCYSPVTPNGMQPVSCEDRQGAVCPGSVSAGKGQATGNALDLGARLEGLQFAGSILSCSGDSGLLKQLQGVVAFLTFPVL